MAGQGITVSIQAKIEGWQEQIKQIQNAMKNIKPGTDISKGLVKDLQQVNDMVNNLGKNMNQRLTSDSQITGFVDKIMQVEEVFGRLGTSMSHISFGDINPEYITAGFKDLLSTLEQANNALGQGMESSFQNAIANSKTLQKEFERMKIDPKTMNIDAIKEALAERGKSLEKDVNDGLKKLTDFEKGLEKLKNARDELTARDKFLGKDANATAQSLLIGHQLPTKGTILDADELDKQISFFRSNLLKAGFTPTQLGRIIPDLESVMKAGHWDEMPSKFAEYLREAQNRTKNSLEKASQDYGAAVLQHQKMAGTQSHLSALRFNNTQAQNEVSNILSGTVQNDTKSLRDIVSNLRQQLESAVTSGFKGLGGKLFSSSQQGMQDASAAMKDYSAALDQVKAKEQAVSKVQGVVQRYFSIYAAVRMVSKGIRSMMNNIRELDKTITEIAIVTKMDQNDLWGQMPQYTKLAKNYAASISGVYKVSQLYYQQGLGQQDVMALTEQTLKMARISGLDYAEATDYMTNAVRSFKMEMTDAATVVDVYSAVAASSASSVTELATAMSKTASSAAAVGSAFENTTAMLAVMIEATRESPENIGSAMKSIISRYGELKENKTGIDEEGEEYSLNKVDKALQTVGISIHDANGEFRDFDDVIFELAEKWNTIDKNTQRYIATVMAGNRQQSRFLALVSSTERLKEESEKAANSEDASQLQFLKTMDSIEAKTQQFQTSLQSLYTSSGLEKLYKGLLDFGNDFANTLENISGKNGLVGAISNVGASFLNMATFATTGFSVIKSKFLQTKNTIEFNAKMAGVDERVKNAQAHYDELMANPVVPISRRGGKRAKNQAAVDQYNAEVKAAGEELKSAKGDKSTLQAENATRMAAQQKMARIQGWGMAASTAGMALGAWANSIDINENRGLKSGLTVGSSALSGIGTGMMVGATAGGPIGALVGVLSALPGVIQGIGMMTETAEERVEKLSKNITEAKNDKIKSKDELKTLEDQKKKYDELSKSQYDSVEKKKEFIELSNSIAESYPELIKSMDAEGNYVLDMTKGYEKLAEAKRNAYKNDIVDLIAAESAGLQDANYVLTQVYGQSPIKNQQDLLGWFDTSKITDLTEMQYGEEPETQLSVVADLFKHDKGAVTANTVFDSITAYGRGNIVPNDEWLAKNILGNTWQTAGKNSKDEGTWFQHLSDQGAEALSEIYIDFIKEIKQGHGYTEAIENISKLHESQEDYIDTIGRFNAELYQELSIRNNLPEYQETLLTDRINTYNGELINLFANSTEDVFDIASNDIQRRFAQEEMNEQFQDWYKKLDEETKSDPKKWAEAVKNFYAQFDTAWYHLERQAEYIDGLTDKENEIYQNLGDYTKKDIEDLFPTQDTTELQGAELERAKIANKRAEFMQKIFKSDYENILETYGKWVEQNESHGIKDYSEKIGAGYLSQIQAQYNAILKNTSLSDKQLQNQINALNDITDFITSDNFTFDQRNALLTKYSATDFSSLFGIQTFIDSLTDLDLDMDEQAAGGQLKALLKAFGSTISTNITTEIDSYVASLTESFQGLDKDLSSAASGMNLKDAAEMGEKLKISLKDFTVRDGKFYLDDLSSIVEYYDKINNEYEEALNESITDKKSKFEKMQDFFTQFKMDTGEYEDIDKWTEGQQTWINDQYGIQYTELKYYYDKFQDYLKDENNPRKVFSDFLIDDLDSALEDGTDAIKQWATQQKSISSLKTLGYDAFIKASGLSQFGEESSQIILKAARDQNFETLKNTNEDLYNAVSPYISTLISFFKDSETSIIDSLIDATGTGKNASITVSTANRDYLKELQSVGLFEGIDFDSVDIIGQSLQILVDEAEGIEEIILQQISEKFTTDAEKLEAYQKYHVNKYKNNKFTNFGKITENIVSYEDFTNYLSTNIGLSADTIGNPAELARAAKMYGLAMNAAGDFYVEDWATRITQLNADLQTLLKPGSNASIEEINEAREKVQEAEQGQKITLRTAAEDILKNYNDISITQQKALANALQVDSSILERFYYTGLDGKTRLNMNLFRSYIQSFPEEIQNNLNPLFADIIDNYLDNISNATTNITRGLTKQSDIQKFVDDYIQVTGQKVDAMQLFEFDSILQAFTLKPEYLQRYISAQRKQLLEAGYAEDMVESYIQSQTIGVAAAAVDIKSYITSDRSTGQIAETTERQIANFQTTIAKQSEVAHEYFTQAEEELNNELLKMPEEQQAQITEKGKTDWIKRRAHDLADQAKEFNESLIGQYGDIITELQTLSPSDILKQFAEGGEKAVQYGEVLAKAQGKELTPEEMQQYYAPLAQKYSNMADQVAELVVGNYVGEGDLRSLLEEVGAVDANTGLVTAAVGEMVSVYQEIYKRMANDANATASQLNSVYAKMLTAQEQGDIDAISVMGDAMGMTYESLGEMLGKYGENLEYWLKDNMDLYKKIGGGKIRITNFTAFADRMGWEAGSEEYTSAFKSYNDSLIELNKKTKESIFNEVSQIESAKVGDQLNLTELYTELQKKIVTQFKYINDKNYGYREVISDPLKDLQEQLSKYRADLTNGILTLSDNANLLGVATTLQAAAEAAGSEMANELADMVQNILKAYTDAIINGIKGGLNNVQAADLRSKASDLGITNLDFDETVEGFKLTQKSAIDLYNAIKQIDGLQGKIVFDSLSESLQESNENFATTTALLNHIVSLRAKLTAADSQISTARREEYEAELELAQQIVAVRSTQEDSTWNFMSNKIPAAQNNPLNYAKNLTQALQTIRDAWNTSKVKKKGKAGFMDYTDFYNIVTELNNMAGMGADIELAGIKLDGSLETASALIQKGAESLTTVDTGDMKVNLAGIGLSLSSGGSSLEKGITSGVESIANAQVEALDGVIAMLELIVAMEQLGDITGKDTKIDLGDIFAVSDEGEATENIELMNGFTKKFKESRENLVNYLKDNKDAQNVFKNTKIKLGNDIRSMYDMMTLEYSTLFGGLEGKQKESAVKAYQGLLDGLYQAAISGNYDLDNIAGSLQEILNAQNIDFDESFTLDVGDITYVVQNGVIVKAADWSDKQVKKVIAKYKKEYGTDDATKTKILEAIQSYLNGQGGGEINVEDIIRVRHTTLIQHDKDGDYVVGTDGTKYRSGSNGYKAILQQAILSDQQGINSGDINVDEKKGIATATITYGVKAKTQTKFTVTTDDNGTITWTDDEGHTGTTQQELLQNIYRDTIPKSQEINMEDFQSWIYTKYGVHLKIKPEVIKDGDTVTDPTQDPDVKAAIKEALGNKTYNIEDIGSGHIEVKLGNNVKVKLNAEDIQYDSETKTYNTSLLSEALGNIIGIDTTLGETITQSITDAIPSIVEGLNQIDAEGPQAAATALGDMLSNLQQLQGIGYEAIAHGLSLLGGNLNSNGKQNGQANTPKVTASTAGAMQGIKTDAIDNITNALGKIKFDNAGLNAAAETVNNISATNAKTAAGAISGIKTGPAMAVQNTLNNLKVGIEGKSVQAIANIIVRVQHGHSKAKGNVALASGTPTLMGELGPELVVSNGRYFVVGQTGAEFVNLEKDAIVFNHKQTQNLLSNGSIGSRGKPFTNETNAISYAKGNWNGGPAHGKENPNEKEIPTNDIPWKTGWTYNYQVITENGGVSGHLWNAPIADITFPASAKGNILGGPAQASASAALAALKQLRAQWQALAGLSAQDLAGKGGGGGGGGGGNKNFLKDLERWYDWLQQIAQLEKEITLEEAKRSKYQNDMIAHGKEYFTSQMASLNKLQQQVATQQSLNESQEAYFEQRRKELNEQSAFSALYGFSETGQLYYKDVYADNKSAFEWLSDLAGRDETTGKANYTAQEQYEKLVAAGFEFAMQYDSSGNEIKKEGDAWYVTAVQAFWDKIDADKEEMQSLHDSVEDGKKEVIDRQNDQNEILHDIEDNQLEVEGKVLKAVEESRQRAIDDAKDERDAIEKSANNLIDGLNSQLDKERTLYQNQQNADELATLQRRLAILQRSGGSVSEIADLRSQIEEKQYDKYFDTQEAQIQAIQDASDAELERLDNQITLMEETLAYEKEHGLLWNDVNQILKGSSEDIVSFIQGNTAEYWAKSSAELSKCLREDIFEVDRFKSFQTSVENGLESLVKMYGGNTDTVEEAQQEEVPKAAEDNGSKYTENAAGQWIQGDNGRWWYKHEDGGWTENNWEKINDKWYYFDEEGWMKTGWLEKDGKWYYLDDTSGEMLANTTKALNYNGKVQNHTFDENGVWTGASDINNTPKKKTTWEYDGTKWVEYALNKDGEKGDATGGYSYSDPTAKKKKKAAGGYVNHGLYELGELGTETVLTASQTKVLRDNILSNRPDSLVNLLKSYNEAYHGLSQNAYDSISNTTANMVNIERAEVNLQIEKLADDYDSKRAANTIMDEMLRIASKTKASNSIRR